MSEKLKLTLTSQALERLIGGDTEIEVEIRQGIANEFAKRHLKGLFSEAISQSIGEYRNSVAATVSGELQRLGINVINVSRYPRIQLSDEVKEEIKTQTLRYVQDQIKPLVEQALKDINLKEMIDRDVFIQSKHAAKAAILDTLREVK